MRYAVPIAELGSIFDYWNSPIRSQKDALLLAT
jgi:hypothetical protein